MLGGLGQLPVRVDDELACDAGVEGFVAFRRLVRSGQPNMAISACALVLATDAILRQFLKGTRPRSRTDDAVIAYELRDNSS